MPSSMTTHLKPFKNIHVKCRKAQIRKYHECGMVARKSAQTLGMRGGELTIAATTKRRSAASELEGSKRPGDGCLEP